MATNGKGTTSSGDNYSWDIAGFGYREGGSWNERSPSEATIKNHIADSDWGMLIHWEIDGVDNYAFVHGGYDPDGLADVVDKLIEDYG